VELDVQGLSFSYPNKEVLRDVAFTAQSGEVLGIIGPNGSGKTTLLKCLRLALRPQEGTIKLNGKSIMGWSRAKLARFFAVVPQSPVISFPFSVLDIVMMGRTPHMSRFQREGRKDFDIVREALHLTSVDQLYDRPVSELSGGEMQRVIISRALAQQPHILLLDEPTSQLDINHQIEVMKLVQDLARKRGIIVILISHDLNLSMRYCDKLLLLSEGAVFEHGAPADVLTPDSIRKVYGVEAQVGYNTAIEAHDVTIIDSI